MKNLHLQITEALHHAFKVECAQNNQSIKDALIELINYYVENKMEKQDANK